MFSSTFKVCDDLNSGERRFHEVWSSVEMKNKKGRILVSNMNLPVARDSTPKITKHVGVHVVSLFCL